MTGCLLSVRRMTAGYGDITVVRDASLQVSDGQIVCLIGSNGAGKTTLLRALSGLVRRDGETCRFRGEDMRRMTPQDIVALGLVHVPEGRRLFQTMSVKDNLLMGAYLRNDRGGIAADLDRVMTIFPKLRERASQDASTMSGGEQQMCAIGRGLMAQPKLLLIDELSLGLSPRLVDELVAALKTVNDQGISVLLIEQDVMTALDVAQYGFVLDQGRITKSGRAADLAADGGIQAAYLGQ
ncbi:ABC transporter ATP-binding protein [Bradyrhizobium sp. 5.13L]